MRNICVLVCCLLLTFDLLAQEDSSLSLEDIQKRTETLEKKISKLSKLKISGYIQGQFQYGEKEAKLNVGSDNNDLHKSFNRIGIRRGRIKLAYEEEIVEGVFQLDLTEKGIYVKDLYVNMKDPWIKSTQLRVGIFNRPFGFEIKHSSSKRETPERSTIFRTLFPQERDLGAVLIIQAPKSSAWSMLKLEAGLFAGNGIKQETDNRKDFIGHLSFNKTIGNVISLELGISYYNGGVYQGNQNIYKVQGKTFILDNRDSNKGKFAQREYFGCNMQFSIFSSIGKTQLRGEYLFGQQPGNLESSKSPNSSSLPEYDTYIRDFMGWYVVFVQDIGTLPFSAVAKYDYYDPNTKVEKNEIGENGTGKTDLSQNTFGFGGIWKVNNSLLLQAYYEINKNEKTVNVEGMNTDIENNVFTLRLQYNF